MKLLNELELDVNNGIEYNHFLVTCCNKEKILNEHALRTSFKMWDIQNKGYINLEDIQKVLSTGNFGSISQEESPLEYILLEMGLSHHDQITYEQFKKILSKFVEDEKVKQSLTQY